MLWVAAGPGSNIVQALVWALVAKLLDMSDVARLSRRSGSRSRWRASRGTSCSRSSTSSRSLPLDGGRMLTSVLPNSARLQVLAARALRHGVPHGFIILITTVPGSATALAPCSAWPPISRLLLFGLQ
jgi:hypothetical protein